MRVRDLEKNRWVESGIYVSPNNELYTSKRFLFNLVKLVLQEDDRYVIHKDIGLYDKNNLLVYEGDYVKAQVSEDREVVGLVTYAPELAAYIILCTEQDEYWVLGTNICEYIEVIGNVFDGTEKYGRQNQ